MSYAGKSTVRPAFAASALGLALAIGFASGAAAQDKAAAPAAKDAKPAAAAPAAAPAAGAAPAAAADAGKQSSWVKLCDKVQSAKKGDDGKEVKEEKEVCATFHDTIDANSGMTVVSAAMRQVSGDDKPDLQVTVPLGMIIPAGARVSVLTNEQTEAIKAKKEIDPKDVKTVDLKFTACLPNGCTAEIEAPADVMDLMKKGGSLLVRSVYVNGQGFAVPVPLNGFAEAFAGKPIDNEVYKKARGEMMKQIKERQAQLVEKFKAEKEAKLKEIPPPPGFKEGQPVTAEKPKQ